MGGKNKLKQIVGELESKLSALEWKLGRLSHDLEGIGRKANGLHIMDLNVEPEPVEQEKDLTEAKAFLYSVWYSTGTTREAIMPTIVKCSLKAAYWMKTYSMSARKLHDILESLTEEDIDVIEEELTKIKIK